MLSEKINHVSGPVYGSALQAENVYGNVHLQASATSVQSEVPRPFQLPAFVPPFVNREAQVAALNNLVATAHEGVLRIVVISGQGGIGKTATAIRGLQSAGKVFEAGVLYGDLRGFATDGPVGVGVVLRRWLTALGERLVPADLDEASALFRDRTARRPVAALLDNATDAAGVHALMPGSGLLVVTSRYRLEALVVHGAQPIHLDPLGIEAGTELAELLLGERAGAEPEAVRTLARVCAGVPLALRINAARLLTTRIHQSVADAVQELTCAPDRRLHLNAGEISMQETLDASYRALPDEDTRQAYRQLAACPGDSFTVELAGAVLETDRAATETRIDALVRASLLNDLDDRRYRFDEHTQSHARHLASIHFDEFGESEAASALARAVAYLLRTSAAAELRLAPRRRRLSPIFNIVGQNPSFPGTRTASAWLRAEGPNVLAAQMAAERAGAHGPAWQFVETMRQYFLDFHDYNLYGQVLATALTAAERIGDAQILAQIHTNAGFFFRSQGDGGLAHHHLMAALQFSRRAGDPLGEASAHENMGLLQRRQNRRRDALDSFTTSLAIYQRIGIEERGAALTRHQIGITLTDLGRFDEAGPHLQEALSAYTGLGDGYNQARALASIADLHLRRGTPESALPRLEQARTLMDDRVSPYNLAAVLTLTAEAHDQLGQPADARALIEEALQTYRSLPSIPDDHAEYQRARRLAARLNADPARHALDAQSPDA